MARTPSARVVARDGEVALRVADARDVARGAREDAREDARAPRTLKLRLATDETTEVVVVERERWRDVATIEDVERGATVAVARAALARTTMGVALANAGEVRAAARGDDDFATRERAARDARGDLDARSTSDVAAKAPKFVAFDPSEAARARAGAASTPTSEVARRLAATTLRAAPAATARRRACDGDGDGAGADDDPPAPVIVRKKPALPPGRRAAVDA